MNSPQWPSFQGRPVVGEVTSWQCFALVPCECHEHPGPHWHACRRYAHPAAHLCWQHRRQPQVARLDRLESL